MTSRGFDRGTPAGNLIHNIYGGKKSMDSTLDPELAARLRKFRAEQEAKVNPKVKPTPKSRAHVNVPRMTGPKMSDEERNTRIAEWKLAAVGNRKREGAIKEEQAHAEPLAPPTYAKPAMTEQAKFQFQQQLEFGKEHLQKAARNRNSPGRRRQRQVDADSVRFDEVVIELRDKKEFLKELQGDTLANGKAKLCAGMDKAERKNLEGRLLIEIQDLLEEMKDLDRKLKAKPTIYDDDDDDDVDEGYE